MFRDTVRLSVSVLRQARANVSADHGIDQSLATVESQSLAEELLLAAATPSEYIGIQNVPLRGSAKRQLPLPMLTTFH